MSRLVNYGLGELCDRVSILSLKILHGQENGIDVAHFREELATLAPQLVAHDNGDWLLSFVDLATVNGTLWYCEDVIRARRAAIQAEADQGVIAEHRRAAGALGIHIATLNDERNALIRKLNEREGATPPEKVGQP